MIHSVRIKLVSWAAESGRDSENSVSCRRNAVKESLEPLPHESIRLFFKISVRRRYWTNLSLLKESGFSRRRREIALRELGSFEERLQLSHILHAVIQELDEAPEPQMQILTVGDCKFSLCR